MKKLISALSILPITLFSPLLAIDKNEFNKKMEEWAAFKNLPVELVEYAKEKHKGDAVLMIIENDEPRKTAFVDSNLIEFMRKNDYDLYIFSPVFHSHLFAEEFQKYIDEIEEDKNITMFIIAKHPLVISDRINCLGQLTRQYRIIWLDHLEKPWVFRSPVVNLILFVCQARKPNIWCDKPEKSAEEIFLEWLEAKEVRSYATEKNIRSDYLYIEKDQNGWLRVWAKTDDGKEIKVEELKPIVKRKNR